jgi:hypothetical protein
MNHSCQLQSSFDLVRSRSEVRKCLARVLGLGVRTSLWASCPGERLTTWMAAAVVDFFNCAVDIDPFTLRLPAPPRVSLSGCLGFGFLQRRQQSHRLYSDGTKTRLQKPLVEKMRKQEAGYMSYLTWDTRARLREDFTEVALRVPISRTSQGTTWLNPKFRWKGLASVRSVMVHVCRWLGRMWVSILQQQFYWFFVLPAPASFAGYLDRSQKRKIMTSRQGSLNLHGHSSNNSPVKIKCEWQLLISLTVVGCFSRTTRRSYPCASASTNWTMRVLTSE